MVCIGVRGECIVKGHLDAQLQVKTAAVTEPNLEATRDEWCVICPNAGHDMSKCRSLQNLITWRY